MRVMIQVYRLNEASGAVTPFLAPPMLELGSFDMARAAVMALLSQQRIPAHSISIDAEDGSLSERWFWLDGEWRQMDA